jgi:hypothetical protein
MLVRFACLNVEDCCWSDGVDYIRDDAEDFGVNGFQGANDSMQW